MSSLRRRILGPSGDSPIESAEASRDPSPAKGEAVTLIPAAQLKKLKSKKSKRRQGLIFGLGGLFGLVVAAFFADQHDVINLEGLVDFNLDSLLDVIPAGIVKDAKDITVGFSVYSLFIGKAKAEYADADAGDSDMSAKQ